MEVAREHKHRGLPLSVIVIDFLHWTLMASGNSTQNAGLTAGDDRRTGFNGH